MTSGTSRLIAVATTLLLPLLPQTPPPDLLAGSWLNANLQTASITQVVVRRDNTRTFVHVWGSCRPSDCDWGETPAEQWNAVTLARWDHGFAIETMQLIPQPDGRLLVVGHTQYRDGSARTDSDRVDFFVRETSTPETSEALQARELLHRVAENYRTLPASRFESTETVVRSAGTSEVRSEVRAKLLFSPPNRWRRELTRGGEPQVDIADGRTRWTVYPESNEYTSVPQGSANQPFDYGLLDKGRSTPQIVRRERLDGVDCTVVKIDLGRGVMEDVWIDGATHLVRKEVTIDPTTRREVIFTMAHVGETIPDEALTYAPEATHAVNRREAARRAPETMVGKPAPDIALPDLAGREVRLSDLRGKVVLLDFWATWCGPCREALPMIELYHRGLRANGLVVYGVDDEAAEIPRQYLKKAGLTLPSLVDSKGEATRRFRVQAWPTTVLIDRNGTVVFYAAGADPDKLRDAIRAAGAW